jgi:hypothetical protein
LFLASLALTYGEKMQNSSGMEIWSGLTHGNATCQKKIFVSSIIGIDIWSTKKMQNSNAMKIWSEAPHRNRHMIKLE